MRRKRRSASEMLRIKAAIVSALYEDHPMSVRQVFYRLVTMDEIGKTEAEYKKTVVRLLGDMRRSGLIPYEWIADSTRWMRKPQTYNSLEDALQLTKETYRRALWSNQESYVEIWLEKEALSGVLHPITYEWDVPLMVVRGYSSLSYLHGAANAVKNALSRDKRPHLFYLGDHDPSGKDIPRAIKEGIAEIGNLTPGIDFAFHPVAVTEEQIREWRLPTRPTKASDPRSKKFKGESVELDAIPPRKLRKLVEACITSLIDEEQWRRAELIEAQERKTLDTVVSSMRDIL